MLLITAALRQEVGDLKRHLEMGSHYYFAPCHFYKGRLAGKDVGLLVTSVAPDLTKLRQVFSDISAFSAIEAIVCSGCGGGLDSRLQVGDLVLADRLLADGGAEGPLREYPVDSALFSALRRSAEAVAIPHLVGGIFSSDHVLHTSLEKEALSARTGALMVDMENSLLAEIAADRKIPIASIRSVYDPISQDLSPAILNLVDSEGDFSVSGGIDLLKTSAKDVWQLPSYSKSAQKVRKSLEAFFLHFVATI